MSRSIIVGQGGDFHVSSAEIVLKVDDVLKEQYSEAEPAPHDTFYTL